MTLETLKDVYRIQLVPELSPELVDEVVENCYRAGLAAAVSHIRKNIVNIDMHPMLATRMEFDSEEFGELLEAAKNLA